MLACHLQTTQKTVNGIATVDTQEMKKAVQVDWLSTWFKPRVRFVSNNQFIDAVRSIEAQGARINAIDVKRGGYILHLNKETNGATNEGMAGQGPGTVKG